MSTDSGRGMINGFRDRHKNQKGSIMLEFTFAVSILLVIFLAAVTFSFLFADYYGVQKVAREGAREASITRDTGRAGIKALEAGWLWGLDPGKMAVNFSGDGKTVTCSVTYSATPFHKTFPRLVNSNPLNDVTMNARATFVWSSSR